MLSRSSIRPIGLLVLLFGLVAAVAAFVLPERSADAVTETIAEGYIRVTTSGTENLSDGSTIEIKVDALNGANLNQVSAVQCNQAVDNNFSFSGGGGYCAVDPMSPANVNAPNFTAEAISGPFAPGTLTTTFTYKVGKGTQDVTDMLTGETRRINCIEGAGNNCKLVLWIQQSKNAETYFVTPLTFGAAGPTTTTGSTPGSGPSTTATTNPGATTTTSNSGDPTTTTTTSATTSTSNGGTTSTSASTSSSSLSSTSFGSPGTAGTNGSVPPIDSAVSPADVALGDSATGDGSTGSLPLTGTQATGLLGIAALLVAAGVVFLIARRRVDV